MNWVKLADGFLDWCDNIKRSLNVRKFKFRFEMSVKYLPTIVLIVLLIVLLLKKAIRKIAEIKTDFSTSSDYAGSEIVNAAIGHEAKITSEYGADRRGNRTPEQIARGKTYHEGVDIAAEYGTPVYAAMDAKVIRAKNNTSGAGGRSITISPDGGKTQVYYAHLSEISVNVGQEVKKGQQIGKSGASGHGKERAYGPHLHIQLGVTENGKFHYVNPMKYGPKDSTDSSAGYPTANLSASAITDIPDMNKIKQGAGVGVRAHNPGNDTFYQSANPWWNGKKVYNSSGRSFAAYNSWTEGYAGNAFLLLWYLGGSTYQGRNPSYRAVCAKWVNGSRSISEAEIQKRCKSAGIKDPDARLPITQEVLLRCVWGIAVHDSNHMNMAEAKAGVAMAWNYWIAHGGKPDSNPTVKAVVTEKSVKAVNNASNRRQ